VPGAGPMEVKATIESRQLVKKHITSPPPSRRTLLPPGGRVLSPKCRYLDYGRIRAPFLQVADADGG